MNNKQYKQPKQNKTPNIYKIAYKLMTMLDCEKPENSNAKAIKVVQKQLKADSTMLFKKNHTGKFDLLVASNDLYSQQLKHIVDIYNKKRKRDFDIELKDDNIHRLMILNIPVNGDMYALAVTNGYSLNDNKESINVLKNSIKNIIINSRLIQQLRIASVTDILTSVKNRTCYEMDKSDYEQKEEKIVTYVISDLFGLKHINDTYGHEKGDKYLIDAGHILKLVFNDSKTDVYRLGGDEFVIITKENNLANLDKKLKLVSDLVSNIDLSIEANEKLMISFGISQGSTRKIDELYREADEQLSNNKKELYEKLKIKRRQSDI